MGVRPGAGAQGIVAIHSPYGLAHHPAILALALAACPAPKCCSLLTCGPIPCAQLSTPCPQGLQLVSMETLLAHSIQCLWRWVQAYGLGCSGSGAASASGSDSSSNSWKGVPLLGQLGSPGLAGPNMHTMTPGCPPQSTSKSGYMQLS